MKRMMNSHGLEQTSLEQPRPMSDKRAAKRDAILRDATLRINAYGPGGFSLSDVAKAVGISRNSLYYYVPDRLDLVFQCYQRTCDFLSNILDEVDLSELGHADRLRRFMENVLASDESSQVTMTDIDCLADVHRRAVRERVQRLIDRLEALIRSGIAAGEFRPCNTSAAVHLAFGMINYARIAHHWASFSDDYETRMRLVRSFCDLILFGISSDPRSDISCPIEISSLTQISVSLFDRQRLQELKADELAGAASRLFNLRGVEAVTMDEIGAEIGATKGLIYQYFNTKTDLVAHCISLSLRHTNLAADTAVNFQGSGLRRIAVCFNLNFQAQLSLLPPLLIQPSLAQQKSDVLENIRSDSDRNTQIFDDLIRNAVEDGSCREVDAFFTGLAAAGSLTWIPRWLPTTERSEPKVAADTVTDIILHGIGLRI